MTQYCQFSAVKPDDSMRLESASVNIVFSFLRHACSGYCAAFLCFAACSAVSTISENSLMNRYRPNSATNTIAMRKSATNRLSVKDTEIPPYSCLADATAPAHADFLNSQKKPFPHLL